MSYENTADNKTVSKSTDKTTKKAFFKKRKGCPLSVPGAPIIDYKNPELLRKFTSEGGRMLPRRITGVSAKKQRLLSNKTKIARFLSLLPYVFQIK